MKQVILTIVSGFLIHTAFSQKVIEQDFSSIFHQYGVDGCFVLYNQKDNEYIKYHSGLCDTAYIPASTFKIPNSLIALEEGIVKDASQVIRWDGHEWPNESWNKDQTLRTAIKYSCIWVYFGFAEQIGIKKYQAYLNAFDYGNKNLTGPPTRFWLTEPFRISANQQIDFLRKFYNYELPDISARSVDIVKDIIVLEQTDHFTISGKTGGGILSETEYIMWLVGYVVKDSEPYFYAMNFKSNDFESMKQVRYEITRSILSALSLVE